MQSIRLSLVLQVVLAALTLGACLGAILPRLPDLAAIRAEPVSQPAAPAAVALGSANASAPAASNAANASGGIADPPAGGASLQVQVRAEVQASGNANAEAQALGPGSTQAKANTLGPGSGQAVAYSTDPNQTTPQVPTQASQASLPPTSANTVPAGFTNGPSLTVREAIVNVRNGPSTQNTIVGMATQGQQFTPVGRTADGSWWKICCYDSQLVWVAGALMDARGALDNIEVINVAAQPVAPVVAAVPTAVPTVPTAPAAPPAPSYEFSLVEKNQFAETITPRVYLYIAQGAAGLGGYTLRVKKDNVYLPVNVDSFDGQPSITWPLPIERQRFYNLKVEFPGISVAGTWEIQAVEDGTGKAVSAPVVFNLVPNDPRQEMYISLRR